MWFHNLARYLLSHPAWLVCWLMGIAFVFSIVVDIDHPLHYYLHWGEHGRYLHKYLVVVGFVSVGCGLGIIVTLVCRYCRTGVLK